MYICVCIYMCVHIYIYIYIYVSGVVAAEERIKQKNILNKKWQKFSKFNKNINLQIQKSQDLQAGLLCRKLYMAVDSQTAENQR